MKKGSALLVVLGMISFMVISAVAFSAYMRYNRLPSSYLRRTSASRHLVHAALAEAIDYLDASIGNDPWPGLGNDGASYMYPRAGGRTQKRNYWRDRCFIGSNQLVRAENVNGRDILPTASTLTLEGLAYIPPSLINDARYYSRHADTARWQDLGYDSGRFAFFVLDVSDCFDVNRVPANWARNSSDLGRFSLAWAFEKSDHASYVASPAAWDNFMDNFVDFDGRMSGVPGANSGGSKMPLVSLADLNLAVYAKAGTLAQYVSPFCNYLMNGTAFVTDETGDVAEMMRAFNVITDGLYPPMAVGAEDADIANPEDQPFTTIDTGDTQPNNRTVLQRIRTRGVGKVLSTELPPLDLINLYDYLDENDIPTSLALPTTERVPMVCGLQGAMKLRLEPTAEKKDEPDRTTVEDGGEFVETTTCKLKISGTGALTALWMFPFHRDSDVPTTGYPAETALRIGFLTGNPGLRTKSDSALVVQNDGDFTTAGVVNRAICPKVQTATLAFSAVREPKDTLKKQDLTVSLNEANSWFNGQALMTIKKTYVVHVDNSTGVPQRTYDENVGKRDVWINDDFKPLAGDGVGDGGLTPEHVKGGGTVIVRPYMSVTSRVKNSNGKTVDLVPASGADDKKYNQINTDNVIVNLGGGTTTHPLISFAGDKEIAVGEEFFTKGEPVDFVIQPNDKGGYLTCPDPRWNYAPENFLLADGTISESQFLDSCGVGTEGRDDDVFMFVSNQGYLQSISELAFLPRTAMDFGGGNETTGECGFSFDRTEFTTDRAQLKNWALMWRTYRLWAKEGGYARDPIYELGVFDGGRGPRANPYSTSVYATLSALANTPYSWWAASTNYNAVGKANVPDDNAEQFNKKYAFNAMNDDARFAWEDLKKVAENLNNAMRANKDGDWIKGWDSLEWDNDNHDFCGVDFADTDELYDVDRKFLYGYWRDCFAPKQQLFLIFVRAEPLMMGGGRVGQSPPQLGARAVALVWRNPASGSSPRLVAGSSEEKSEYRPKGGNTSAASGGGQKQNTPHKTRILFYRQFD